jgi:hypothetical protein
MCLCSSLILLQNATTFNSLTCDIGGIKKKIFHLLLNIVSLLKCDCYERKHSVCAVYS